MSVLLDRIKEHAGLDQVRTIEVPEWGEPGQPLIIHYRPASLADLGAVQELDPKNSAKQEARLICRKAMDKDGKPLFSPHDAMALIEVGAPEVLRRIANAIVGRADTEEATKKLLEDPELRFVFALAVRLRRLPDEIRSMSVTDYALLRAELLLEAEESRWK